MSHRAAWLAWSVCAVSLVLVAFSLLLVFLGWSEPLPRGWSPWQDQALSSVGNIGAPILGGLIASRRPENPYGWIWLGLGLSSAIVVLAEPYAAYALVAEPGSLAAPRMVNMALGSGWVVLVTLLPFVLLMFPTGRIPSPRWRFLVWVILAAGTTAFILGFFTRHGGQGPIENPLAVGGVVGEAIPVLVLGAIMILFSSIILSALSLVVRYHRASGVERQQLKWVALAAVLFIGLIVADQLRLDRLLGGSLWNLLDVATTAGLYVAVGIAILKHRLYDIDIIINRTLVYAMLTALLAAGYVATIMAFQGIGSLVYQLPFRTLFGQESALATVAATLAMAALFNPLRRRIQSFIDRRFYRSKYDAIKTLEAFSVKLRDETDLEALHGDLVGVVRESMQPAHVSLWLRPFDDMGRRKELPW
jgi:hypothetical protein